MLSFSAISFSGRSVWMRLGAYVYRPVTFGSLPIFIGSLPISNYHVWVCFFPYRTAQHTCTRTSNKTLLVFPRHFTSHVSIQRNQSHLYVHLSALWQLKKKSTPMLCKSFMRMCVCLSWQRDLCAERLGFHLCIAQGLNIVPCQRGGVSTNPPHMRATTSQNLFCCLLTIGE